jgi:ribosomal protein S18 acetylase RimI-like enzyme
MAKHVLDNVVWNALSTRQAQFAEGDELAKRFLCEIGPLAGLREQSHDAYRSLSQLLKPGEPVALFLDADPQLPQDWQMILHKPIVQMICLNPPVAPQNQGIVFEPLGDADVPAMLELTALTEPGPFRQRTYELGGFLGIRQQGRLAAMAGQRLAPPGYTEVSAVCTHPDFRGRGYAQLLVAEVARRIQASGETPFLTAYEHNTGAIRVYQAVGFELRRTLHVVVTATGPTKSVNPW